MPRCARLVGLSWQRPTCVMCFGRFYSFKTISLSTEFGENFKTIVIVLVNNFLKVDLVHIIYTDDAGLLHAEL